MKSKILFAAVFAAFVGATMVPTPVSADPPSWAPAHGWRKDKNVDKRAERTEKRETRALRLRDPDATATDLNRSQLNKLDRQNRRESNLTRTERENRQLRREREIARVERENRSLRREQRSGIPRILLNN
jgi:hypothetical protein